MRSGIKVQHNINGFTGVTTGNTKPAPDAHQNRQTLLHEIAFDEFTSKVEKTKDGKPVVVAAHKEFVGEHLFHEVAVEPVKAATAAAK